MGLFEGFQITGAIIGLLIALYSAYWIYFWKYNFWAGKPITTAKTIPLFGLSLRVLLGGESIGEVDRDSYKKYGRLFGTYNGIYPVIYIAEPELLKDILVKNFASFSTRRVLKTGDPIMDNMISVIEGNEQWRNLRNTITPAFATGRLKKMIPLICDCAKNCVKNFEIFTKNGEEVDCKRMYGSYTLDVIANVAYGTKINSLDDPDNEFVKHAKEVFTLKLGLKTLFTILMPKLARQFGYSFFAKESLDFFKELITEIIKRREKAKEVHHDFLQLMMDSLKDDNADNMMKSKAVDEDADPSIKNVEQIKRKPLNKDEFLAQVVIFFIGGYETIATTLTTVTYFLATNPECQKKALEEVDRVWKDRESIDAEAAFEAKYIGAAIDEALRHSPPANRLDRTCIKDFKLGDTGITIPAGMLVQVPTLAMHFDPEFFPEPEKFKPERFLGESKAAIANSYTYLPFGAGPRNCVAMRFALLEVKMCLLYVLKEFEFVPSAKTKIPMEYMHTILMQPKDVILHANKRIKNQSH